MTDSLRQKLAAVLDGIVDIALSENETDSYPYGVYDMTTYPLVDKDGVYGFRGDTTIRLVSDDLNAIDTIRSEVETSIEDGMRDNVFSSRLVDTTKECVDGVWTIELTYTLKQYADWEPTQAQETE